MLRRRIEQEATVETIWDWVTIFAFAGLVTLLLQLFNDDGSMGKGGACQRIKGSILG